MTRSDSERDKLNSLIGCCCSHLPALLLIRCLALTAGQTTGGAAADQSDRMAMSGLLMATTPPAAG